MRQLRTPEHWVPATLVRPADEGIARVDDHPVKDGGASGAGLRAYVLPVGAAPGAVRGLDAVLRLAGVDRA
ncbi:hypothetical protein ACIRL0_17120 [Streptomyces sp. NPDC102365]|uniref:hypothetical protein n=1 Tax=Streptomyces sp. NPDC102365 TaxID=3366162 RepID=UPI00380E9B6F